MSVVKMLGDVLRECHEEKRTGVLFVAVKEKSENLIRLFFQEGEIRHVSYGSCNGKDCLDILDCYEFTTAYFVKDMKAPSSSADLPGTARIIEQFVQLGRTVAMK